MRRTLFTLTVLAAASITLAGCDEPDTSAAPSSSSLEQLTAEQPIEPTGRAYLPAPATSSPSTMNPAPTTTPQRQPARPASPSSASPSVTEAPAPAAVNPQPAPSAPVVVTEPELLDPEHPDLEPQSPDEVIGSYRCGDTNLVVVAIAADGSYVCGEVAP